MASLSGKDGSVTGLGATEVKKWTMDFDIDLLDATNMTSNGWREFISGLRGASGSVDLVGDTIPPTAGTSITLTLESDDAGGAPAVTVTGTAYLSKVNVESVVDGLVTFSADYSYTSTVTIS